MSDFHHVLGPELHQWFQGAARTHPWLGGMLETIMRGELTPTSAHDFRRVWEGARGPRSKCLPVAQIIASTQGRKVVVANGCFDILHAGHAHTLAWARGQGDALIVAVNSDASCRRLKGSGRPRVPLRDRMHLLAALACVDYVVPFSEDTPERLLRDLRPAVLVKGHDSQGKDIPGAELVKEVLFAPDGGFSLHSSDFAMV